MVYLDPFRKDEFLNNPASTEIRTSEYVVQCILRNVVDWGLKCDRLTVVYWHLLCSPEISCCANIALVVEAMADITVGSLDHCWIAVTKPN